MSVDGRMETEPLKGQQEEVVVPGMCSGKEVCEEKLSGWRTAAFLTSIFISLTVVFAFSFILPCPVRPQYLPTWNLTLRTAAETYNFLATGYANNDKVLDIFIIFKSSEGYMNHTGEGLPSPYLFLLSLDGTNGSALWERPLSPEFDWVECGVGNKRNLCVVSHDNKLTTIDLHTGKILWNFTVSPEVKVHPPVINLPGLKTNDIAILSYSHNSTHSEVEFLSGKSGEKIGSESLVVNGTIRSHLQFSTQTEPQDLLLHTDSGLYAAGLKILGVKKQKLDKIYKCDKCLQAVEKVRGGYPSPSTSLLLRTNSTVTLFNTKTQSLTWTTNTSTLISSPSFGSFNKDGVPDVVLEEKHNSSTKRVVILDGEKGSVMWEVFIQFSRNTTHSASVLTLNHYSVFMLWGEPNDTIAEELASYLLHPLYHDVLLQRINTNQHIVAFKALLLERGRHACYFVLSQEDGTVVLTKRKIKGDVSNSTVLSVGGNRGLNGEAFGQAKSVKEEFLRLRFSDQSP